ncbi:MAG: hypothetical protein ABI461_13280 [Polyangiaceae bacterium]
MGPVVYVLSIVGGVGLVQAAVWIPLVHRWNKKSGQYYAALQKELGASGEKMLVPPERGGYEGSTGDYSNIRGTGKLMLTDRRLLFRKLTGGVVEIPVKKLKGFRESSTYNGSAIGGNRFLIIETTGSTDVGFTVQNRETWKATLTRIIDGE